MDRFTALADPTRRTIIELLAKHGEMAASEIYSNFPLTPSAISQHLRALKASRLLKMEKRAQQRIYSIETQELQAIESWIKSVRGLWEESFDALEAHLEKKKSQR